MLLALSKGNEDFLQLARIALIEAFATFDPTRGAIFSSWAYKTILWRINEAREIESQRVPTVTLTHAVNGKNPEEKVMDLESSIHLKSALGTLSPRQGVIMDAVLRGETYGDVGQTLGIGKTRVHQEVQVSVSILAELLEDDQSE